MTLRLLTWEEKGTGKPSMMMFEAGSKNGGGSTQTLDQNIKEGGKTCLQYRSTIQTV